ncbi:MAG TPA: 3-dehydroquinate synthase [Planctomycetota bacterium]|jgi:3-dehydroquinate synthase|nr:3-dehydroquinate synthase [Planctomycetota bacterium]
MARRAVVEVSLGERSYSVRIGEGVFAELRELLARLAPTSILYALDEEIAARHRSLGESPGPAARFPVPGGEGAKSPERLLAAWEAFSRAGLDRGSLVVAAGGGSLTDLVGFAAATWHRGIPWVAVPTTLLGMVDAAVGGKTAIDLPAGKNLAGAFHQPRAVLCDLSFLGTLPDEGFATGLSEAVKAAVVGDPELFVLLEGSAGAGGAERLRRDPERILEVVRRAVAVKAGIVSRDERESGERRKLNFGHTIGHAIEKASGFAVPHGRAVAVGMVLECRVAEARGMFDPLERARVEGVLGALGLPTSLPRLDPGAVFAALPADKKARGGRLAFALPRGVGRVEVVEGLDPREVEPILRSAAG